jgi:hypothetical protein
VACVEADKGPQDLADSGEVAEGSWIRDRQDVAGQITDVEARVAALTSSVASALERLEQMEQLLCSLGEAFIHHDHSLQRDAFGPKVEPTRAPSSRDRELMLLNLAVAVQRSKSIRREIQDLPTGNTK